MGLEKKLSKANYTLQSSCLKAHKENNFRTQYKIAVMNSSYEFNKENCRFKIKSKQLNLPQ